VATNTEFRSRYGSFEGAIKDSWRGFRTAIDEEMGHPQQHTLISTDMTPSHWRQRAGEPVFIDWEQARYGPLYLDLPNMFNDKTVKHYYHALLECGVTVDREEFADKFASLSRYPFSLPERWTGILVGHQQIGTGLLEVFRRAILRGVRPNRSSGLPTPRPWLG